MAPGDAAPLTGSDPSSRYNELYRMEESDYKNPGVVKDKYGTINMAAAKENRLYWAVHARFTAEQLPGPLSKLRLPIKKIKKRPKANIQGKTDESRKIPDGIGWRKRARDDSSEPDSEDDQVEDDEGDEDDDEEDQGGTYESSSDEVMVPRSKKPRSCKGTTRETAQTLHHDTSNTVACGSIVSDRQSGRNAQGDLDSTDEDKDGRHLRETPRQGELARKLSAKLHNGSTNAIIATYIAAHNFMADRQNLEVAQSRLAREIESVKEAESRAVNSIRQIQLAQITR